MRAFSVSILPVLLAATLCAADPPASPQTPPVLELGGQLTVPVGKKCIIVAQTTAKKVTWSAPDTVDTYALDGKRLAVWAKEGTYVIRAMVPSGDDVVAAEIVLTVTGPRPPPVPPTPVPPTPDPVTPAPIPVAGFRVLIVYESADRARYPAAQNAILTSVPIRDYFASHCVKGPDGRTPESRIWDKDTDGYLDSKLWGDAMKRPRTSLPWIVISTGTTGYEGPLPADAAGTLKLLKQYGGN